MKKILSASNKHDGLFKSLRTFACATENILPLHRNKPELKRICRSDEIRWLLNTNETCLCSVLYARWGMFLMSFGFSHLSSSYTQPHHTVHHIPPLRMGGCLSPHEIANFLASGKNYFYTISYLLMNQAHISKGVRVESFTASLQGVLDICRTNLPPPASKSLHI